jgi:hypothetical protein
LSAQGASQPSWDEVASRLEDAQFFWLATVRPDGRPHVIPVLAVWLDGTLYFAAGPSTRKARNLAGLPECVVTADGDDLHLVIEGAVAKVRDSDLLLRVAEAYGGKYGWEVTVRDGAFYAVGAPTAGPPPYDVYRLRPAIAFAFGTDEAYGATRWRFTAP